MALSETELGKVILPNQLQFVDVETGRVLKTPDDAEPTVQHEAAALHGDLMRPTRFFNRDDKPWIFKNIVQTATGLRLIDAGFGKIGNTENLKMVVSIMFREREELKCFEGYYFS